MKRTPSTTDFRDICCIILAGGRGKRMASAKLHKVCFPIVGAPAIVRAIETYKKAGLRRFLVVVGQMADQVMATVAAKHPDVAFVYQPDPGGTGHAALVAARVLQAQAWRGGAMIVMGDKVTRPEVVRDLLESFTASDADAVMTTLPKDSLTTAGRVVRRDGTILGIVELPDIRSARAEGTMLKAGGEQLSADQVEAASSSVNASMYVFRFPPLWKALGALKRDNVQGELYLTDTIEHLCRGGGVDEHLLPDPNDLMAFNTPAELMAIEEVIRQREKIPRVSAGEVSAPGPERLKPLGQWLKVLRRPDAATRAELRRHYGPDPDLAEERRRALLPAVEAAAKWLGPKRPVILCRAPGRINLMGRHVDHRGGHVNVMAISREILLVAAPRDDDVVSLRNVDSKRFSGREFRIRDLLDQADWGDWMDFLGSHTAQSVLRAAPGDWSHYARAPLLRLQHDCRDVPLKGMDCLVGGDIPMGAGLSSSSALVVAFAEAAVSLNNLNIGMRGFIDLCGEGEWFVGTRGGSADHAAIRTGKVGSVSRIGFFPFRIEGDVAFPDDLQTVVADSGAQAVKSRGSRDTFNQRVASYGIAEMLLRRLWPAAAGMEHLRDLAPTKLQVEPADLYRALSHLPQRPSRRQLRKLLPKSEQQELERIFGTHANLGGYDLRGVALYGLGECLRSERFAEVLAQGDLDGVGQLMRVSHDGDRCWRHDAAGGARRHLVRTDNAALEKLAATNADLAAQSGRYACSTRHIDTLVDLAGGIDGVVGAQLAGAGLGGCMMIVVRAEAREELMTRLSSEFYEPHGIPFGVHVCRPVAGAGLFAV